MLTRREAIYIQNTVLCLDRTASVTVTANPAPHRQDSKYTVTFNYRAPAEKYPDWDTTHTVQFGSMPDFWEFARWYANEFGQDVSCHKNLYELCEAAGADLQQLA